MCGRYAASRNPDDLVEEFEVEDKPEQALSPSWNVAPTQEVYAVVERPPREDKEAPPRRRLQVARWGLVPSWAKDASIGSRLINARMETVHEKPAFRRAFASRRALLPADGYFEWYGEVKGKKQPFFIQPSDGGVLAMAGLYELWRDPSVPEDSDVDPWLWTVTVLTTSATDDVGRIHDRMPLLVEPARYADWLDPAADDQDRLRGLLVPAAPGRLTAYPVAKTVNNVRNNGPELVEPLPLQGVPADADEPQLSDVPAEVSLVPTPLGDARLHRHRADDPVATLVLGHGAGGGVGTADLAVLAGRLPAAGVEVVLVDQPWVVAGRKVAAPPPTLDRGWLAVLEPLAARRPLLVGGRSAGARVACRTAEQLGAAGVLALAFPLHPPGRDVTRLPELDLPAAAGIPVLVLQGSRDPFGGPDEFPAAPGRAVVPVEGGDHSFRVLKGGDRRGILDRLAVAAEAWAREVCPG